MIVTFQYDNGNWELKLDTWSKREVGGVTLMGSTRGNGVAAMEYYDDINQRLFVWQRDKGWTRADC